MLGTVLFCCCLEHYTRGEEILGATQGKRKSRQGLASRERGRADKKNKAWQIGREGE
jgi:hypothetical protein